MYRIEGVFGMHILGGASVHIKAIGSTHPIPHQSKTIREKDRGQHRWEEPGSFMCPCMLLVHASIYCTTVYTPDDHYHSALLTNLTTITIPHCFPPRRSWTTSRSVGRWLLLSLCSPSSKPSWQIPSQDL